MNEQYLEERESAINGLWCELRYIEGELEKVKLESNYKEYNALMRTYLSTQKSYLNLIKTEAQEDNQKDSLLEFTGKA